MIKMFKLVDSDWKDILVAFDTITTMEDECKIEINQEGIKLTAMDKNHVVFIELILDEQKFDIYECTENKTIHIDTRKLLQVLKIGNQDDIMTWILNENKLQITFEGSMTTQLSIPVIDESYQVPPKPKLDLPIQVNIPGKLFKEAMIHISEFSEKVRIDVDEKTIQMSSLSDFGEDCKVRYDHFREIDEVTRSDYSSILLKNIAKADKFEPILTLEMGEYTPMVATYQNKDETKSLSFIVAPRVAED